ncbi:MAG: hypothetical protein ACFCU6_14445 [Balneolaceae bacterium]
MAQFNPEHKAVLDDSDEYRKYMPVFMESIRYLLKQQGKGDS